MSITEYHKTPRKWFRKPLPSDIVGVNHYITSERFLDDRTSLYPEELVGGNGRHRYVDVEAVRTLSQFDNIGPIIDETWNRYHLPIAITEAHIGAIEDEQIQWLIERWQAAETSKAKGVDIRAVTVWALFGSFFWDCLVTSDNGSYEPGVFDITDGRLIETRLAECVKQLANGVAIPTKSTAWWNSHDRFQYPLAKISDYPARQIQIVS